jgi:hypothetical protein
MTTEEPKYYQTLSPDDKQFIEEADTETLRTELAAARERDDLPYTRAIAHEILQRQKRGEA